jgi:hypothetical protein
MIAALSPIICLAGLVAARFQEPATPLDRIIVATDQKSFALATTGARFVPWGFNYDHDENSRLIEEYWEDEWDKVVEDFREMRQLGANVVRIHLQFGRFMQAPHTPAPNAMARLAQLVRLAEDTGLYLDLTGLACYLKEDVPEWYDRMEETDRWEQQAAFWEAIAKTCQTSPAIFCYDLMNEPVVPGGAQRQADWLGPPFAGKFHFVQFVTRELNNRDRPDVARQWIQTLTRAIRKHDTSHLITVGLVNWSLDRPGLTSGFVPDRVAPTLDFLSIHLYPEKQKIGESIENLRGFADAGKPVLIEETFTLHCPPDDFRRFLSDAWPHAAGVIGFYWGKTPDELRRANTIADAIVLKWLELFEAEAKTLQSKRP